MRTSRNYPITIDISELTDDMIVWARSQSIEVYEQDKKTYIKFPNSKPCHHLAGTRSVRIHMDQCNEHLALLFLFTFQPFIVKQNIIEQYDKQTN